MEAASAAAYPCSTVVASGRLATTASTATAPAAASSLARSSCSKAELRLKRRPSSSFLSSSTLSWSSSSTSLSTSCIRKKPVRTRTVSCSAAGGGAADDRTTDAAASASSSGFSSSSPAADGASAAYIGEGPMPEQQRGVWGFFRRHRSLLGVLLLAGAGVAGFLWFRRSMPAPTAALPPAAALVTTGAPNQAASTGTEGADEKALLKTLRSDPKNEAALRSLLQIRLARGGAKEALDPLNKLIKLCPADLELQLLLGQAQVSMDDLAAARTTYQKVLQVDPYNTVALQGLTAIMQHENEGNAAVDLLREALNKAEGDGHRSRQDRKEAIAGIKLVLGQVLVARGDVGGALQQYDDIIHSLPDDFRPHLSKGFVYTLAGDLQEAEECFTRSRQLCPEDYKSVVEQLIAVSAGESGDLPSEL